MKQSELTPLDVLRAARRLLVEVGWCQGASARDRAGDPVIDSGEPSASYCVRGAIGPRGFGVAEFEAQDLLIKALGVYEAGGVVTWNDTPGRTRDEVVAALDKAIILAGASS